MKYSILLILLLGCFYSIFSQDSKAFESKVIGDANLYKFEPLSLPPFISLQRLNIDPETKIKSVIDTLIFELNNLEYFKKDNITFELDTIENIVFPNKTFRIGIINIIDENKVALGTHFQGSSGGAMTSMTITSNLLQSQLYEPLFDGIIITYNSDALVDMDHVSFDQIIIPRDNFHLVKEAIQSGKR